MPQWEFPIPVIFPDRKRTLEQSDSSQLNKLQNDLQTFVAATEPKRGSLNDSLEEVAKAIEEVTKSVSEAIAHGTIKLT